MEFRDLVKARRSIKKYDPDHAISDAELEAIFEQVILSPSSFNLQHWRFVVVRDAEGKAALRKAAFDQEQVETASAAVVVVGKLNAHQDAPAIYAQAPEAVRAGMLPMIERFYREDAALRRDETIRSASLAAMTLMYAALDLGYATGPMIGFDPRAVSELIGLDEHHVAVMLVVIGRQAGEPRPRPDRHPVFSVVKLETMNGRGLR